MAKMKPPPENLVFGRLRSAEKLIRPPIPLRHGFDTTQTRAHNSQFSPNFTAIPLLSNKPWHYSMDSPKKRPALA